MIYNLKNVARSISHKNKIFSSIYKYANMYKVKILSKVDDEKFAKMKYKENTGKELNLDNPRTFNEKLWWLKLHNRDPLLTMCSDKVMVRDYVKKKGLEHILVPIYGVYNSIEEVKFDELPDKAFIKTNHGSGKNIIWDKNKPFNHKAFKKEFSNSLKNNYYYQSREWNYKNIKPRIIVEKMLVDNPGESLIDYRFLCFDGEVKLLFVDIETAAKDGSHSPYAKRNVYDKDFNYLNIRVKREQFGSSMISKPVNFEKMIEYAEVLSEPFPFCRVDLYNINGNIYFGEITFYPGGATQIVEPEEWEQKMGDWIDLKSDKIKLIK
ncbi:MAG TPA: carboxylate--amine ligase [Gallicola sp.]|nr:carboxylate--amine ligase [Gallicola sp.]